MAADDGWDRVAAHLRRRDEDLATYVRTLGRKLLDALPGQASAQRGGLFGPPVAAVSVDFGDVRYRLDLARPSDRVERAQVVRGVAIRTQEIGIDAFLAELAQRLRQAAAQDEAAVRALERLLL
jgi:hypothetical protein